MVFNAVFSLFLSVLWVSVVVCMPSFQYFDNNQDAAISTCYNVTDMEGLNITQFMATTWHEVARTKNIFENTCSLSTIRYNLNEDVFQMIFDTTTYYGQILTEQTVLTSQFSHIVIKTDNSTAILYSCSLNGRKDQVPEEYVWVLSSSPSSLTAEDLDWTEHPYLKELLDNGSCNVTNESSTQQVETTDTDSTSPSSDKSPTASPDPSSPTSSDSSSTASPDPSSPTPSDSSSTALPDPSSSTSSDSSSTAPPDHPSPPSSDSSSTASPDPSSPTSSDSPSTASPTSSDSSSTASPDPSSPTSSDPSSPTSSDSSSTASPNPSSTASPCSGANEGCSLTTAQPKLPEGFHIPNNNETFYFLAQFVPDSLDE